MSRNYWGLIIIGFLVLIVVAVNFNYDSNDINIQNNTSIYDGINNGTVSVHNTSTNTYSGYGVIFNFPSNWGVQAFNAEGSNTILITPNSANPSNSDEPEFEILVTPNPSGISNQEALNAIKVIPNQIGWTSVSNNTFTLDNNTAYENVITVNNSAIFREIMMLHRINIVKSGNTYSILIQAPTNEFSNENPTFQSILNSFKIN